MTTEQEQLQATIAALEAQRDALGDEVVDRAIAPMRARLDALSGADDPSAPSAPRLKQVTILFLDVVGSTRMSQRLDPEDTSELMDGALSRASAVVRSHRGEVLQYAGDSLLAAFGVDRVSEDDAERAVRCGLALCSLGEDVAADLRARRAGDEGFAVRVGVHTGAVLLGGGVSGAGSIRGSAVNIAARLEQTAPAGRVRISQDTHALVRGLFEVEAQAPLAVKGIDAPLRSYLVIAEKPGPRRGARRGLEGVSTRLVGRRDELAALGEAFRAVRESTSLRAITVVGEAGIGKSRLVEEFVRSAGAEAGGATVIRAGTTPQTQTRAFGLLGDLVTRHLQIADNDPAQTARAKIEDAMASLFAADERAAAEAHAYVLGHLLGIEWDATGAVGGIREDPKQLRHRALHAAALLVRRTAERDGPLVLVLEDLHWADDESLEFVNALVTTHGDAPILVLAVTRPTLFERRGDGIAVGGPHRRLDLAPLDARASSELSDALMDKLGDIPASLRELVTGAAEGNPFYMEELVQMLIDQGAIVVTGDVWQVHAETLHVTAVPPTLTGVLQARLDGLPGDERWPLQQASVIGPVFWDRALRALDGRADAALPGLVRRELVRPRSASALAGFAEYAFRHHLLHQVTYGTVLKRERRELHGRVAAWLASQAELGHVRPGDVLALVAHHFEAAGEEMRAAEYHVRATEHAADRFAQSAVLAHAARALALLDASEAVGGTTPERAALRWRVLLTREKSHHRRGERAQQRLDLEALEAIAEASGNDAMRAEVAMRFGLLARATADWPATERHMREAIRLARAAGDDVKRIQAQESLAIALRGRRRLDEALALASEGLAEASERGLQRSAWGFYRALALITESQGDEFASAQMEREALRVARESGYQVGEAIGLDCMGQVAILLGDLAEAQRWLEEAVALQSQLGLYATQAHALAYLAAVLLWRGDAERSLTVGREAIDVAGATGSRYAQAWANYRVGEAQAALGRHAEASTSFAAAAAIAHDIGSDLERTAKAGLARAALAQGDVAGALVHVEGLLAGPQPERSAPDTTFHPELVAFTCHEVLARAGDAARAAACLREADALMQAVAERIPDPAQRQAHLAAMPHRRAIAAASSPPDRTARRSA